MKTLRFILVLLFPISVLAQNVPALVNYQGRLANPDGSPLPTADYQLSFSISDAPSGGTTIWGPEAFDGGTSTLGHGALVPVVQGYFNVLLGPLDVNNRSLASAFNGSSRFVEVTVSNHAPIAPRQQILTAPFAFQATTATLAGNVVSGINITNATLTGNNTTISGNGAGLTSVPAASLTGTIGNNRLSANVAMLTSSQTFAGQNNFLDPLGVGTNNPSAPLHVFSSNLLVELLDSSSSVGCWLDLRAANGGTNWHLISSAPGNGEGPSKLLFNVGPLPNSGAVDVLTLQPNGWVGIDTSSPGAMLQVGSATCNGVQWLNTSDRNLKEDFDIINPRLVLEKVSALPITEWKYKTDRDGAKHLGPMAQDFHAAFGLNGPDDKHIATADEEGVALAAIQGLNQKLDEKNAEIQALNRRVNELEAMVRALAGKK